MPDESTNAVATDTAAQDTQDNLAAKVRSSYSQTGASDQTIALLDQFVDDYVTSTNTELGPSSGNQSALV